MTGVHEATVEVLTAEVRVLMVGSRQITLSVARQLDEIDAGDITPFGRIETGRKHGPRTTVAHVIGRARDGSLARSVATAERVICLGHPSSSFGRDDSFLTCDAHDLEGERGQRHGWTWFYPDRETHTAWLDLPLIVLAGLR
jgi:hypothetical protein